MAYLARDDAMQDVDFCRRKQADYAAKAAATNNVALKSAYEAAAREYAYRAELVEKKSA
jgi:hypothetical protein